MPDAPTYTLTVTYPGGAEHVHYSGLLWDAARTNLEYSLHLEHDWAMEMATRFGWKVAVTRNA